VLFLKNGSIIKCRLIEYVPEKTLVIQTTDQTRWEYSVADVDSLVQMNFVPQENFPISADSGVPSHSQSKKPKNVRIGIMLGYGYDMGTSVAGAGTHNGWSVAFQTESLWKIGFYMSTGYYAVRSDEGTSKAYFLYLGPEFTILPENGFFIAPFFGLYGNNSILWSWGAAAETHISKRICVGLKYFESEQNLSSGMENSPFLPVSTLMFYCGITTL
jgi:hypothetical protein